MRVTVTLDEELLQRAAELTGVTAPDELVGIALRTLVERESALALARLGGSEPGFRAGRRRRRD